WTGELNELGAPLYVSDGSGAILDVERFVAKFPEIRGVDWYDSNGTPLGSVMEGNGSVEPLADAVMERIEGKSDRESPFVLLRRPATPLAYRPVGPIWSERTLGDGLLALGGALPVETEMQLLGFVGVDIDFSWYRQQFLPKLGIASLALLALLGGSWFL